MDSLAPGRDIGKYRVVRRLATGGMAEIYLAQSRGIEGFAKYVVLKRILPQFASSETFVRLFLNEARVTATLDHPNIAGVHDIGAVDGIYFFTMEYLHGEDLGHILRTLVNRERMPLDLALTIGTGVAAGLHAAHEKKGSDGKPLGIVHRDVSPSNVVVTFDGGVKLVDFGVAKMTAQADLTSTGTLKGKVSYMSPEQCNNEPVDRRSDVFALGVLMYELSTQTRLFRTESEAATLKLVLEANIPPPSSRVRDYPPELEAIVLRALSRDRDQRYQSARDLQLALEEVARGRGLVTSTATLGEWMTHTFGPKLEPWITAPIEERPDPVAAAEAGSAGGNEGSGGDPLDHQPTNYKARIPTRNPPRIPTIDRGPALAPLPGGETDGDPAAGRRWARWIAGHRAAALVALGGALIFAGTGLAVHHWSRPATQATAATPAPVAPPPAASASAPPLVATSNAAGDDGRPPPAPRRSAGRRNATRGPAESKPQAFSSTFARKENDLIACFASHSDAAARAPQISVRFHVGVDGAVNGAEVLPPEVAATALGQCVARVARSAHFEPQPSPVTVRIPVTVRRVGNTGR
jgi:serine/threonine protein kinase